jgi:hypothetical protein
VLFEGGVNGARCVRPGVLEAAADTPPCAAGSSGRAALIGGGRGSGGAGSGMWLASFSGKAYEMSKGFATPVLPEATSI